MQITVQRLIIYFLAIGITTIMLGIIIGFVAYRQPKDDYKAKVKQLKPELSTIKETEIDKVCTLNNSRMDLQEQETQLDEVSISKKLWSCSESTNSSLAEEEIESLKEKVVDLENQLTETINLLKNIRLEQINKQGIEELRSVSGSPSIKKGKCTKFRQLITKFQQDLIGIGDRLRNLKTAKLSTNRPLIDLDLSNNSQEVVQAESTNTSDIGSDSAMEDESLKILDIDEISLSSENEDIIEIPTPDFYIIENCDKYFIKFRNCYFKNTEAEVEAILNKQAENDNTKEISKNHVVDLILLTIYSNNRMNQDLDLDVKLEKLAEILNQMIENGLQKLNSINITHAGLYFVPFRSMIFFERLKKITLSKCKLDNDILALSDFKTATEKHLSELTTLNLSMNMLTEFPDVSCLEKLDSIVLNDNPSLTLKKPLIDYLPIKFKGAENYGAMLRIKGTNVTSKEFTDFKEQSNDNVIVYS